MMLESIMSIPNEVDVIIVGGRQPLPEQPYRDTNSDDVNWVKEAQQL